MQDRELVELAAKAAGIHVHHWFDLNDILMCSSIEGGDPDYGWNPLTNDGDALRLAVKLKMSVDAGCFETEASFAAAAELQCRECDAVQHGDDPYAATRRAIVRAAAEIGSCQASKQVHTA